MKQIRYQVFISSTFRDLQEERQAVLDAILNMNHFPAGMELFPASDSTPWEVIERVIDDSDYYVLIIGGMYGSLDSDGISYTEREYDYAKKTNKPVLAFLHQNPDSIPAGKVEMKQSAQKKLSEFRNKLQNHHCKYWKNPQELQYKVAISLIQEINLNPALGWIRANEASNEDLLKQIVLLRQENDRLQELIRSQTEQASISRTTTKITTPLKLLYCYSHKDEEMRLQLERHLILLRRQGIIGSWSDYRVDLVTERSQANNDEIENADIILLLISVDFLASDFGFGLEMQRVLERHISGEARVVPIILRACNWIGTPFGKITALPKNGRPINSWSDQDAAFTEIAQGIRYIAEKLTMISD